MMPTSISPYSTFSSLLSSSYSPTPTSAASSSSTILTWSRMELKVWVEGIQRVICGVTEATTCQDVVIALARATGKTGRFTLIERWRDNERPLAPSEAPLRVLHKWGEYASEVQFILRLSERDRKKKNGGDWSNSSRAEQFLHNFSPHNQRRLSERRSSASSIKKSLTFSGAHSFFPPMKRNSKKQPSSVQDDSSLESLDEQTSSASFSSKSSTSPYASLDKERMHQHLQHHHNHVPHHGASPLGNLEKQYKSGHNLKPSPQNSPKTSISSSTSVQGAGRERDRPRVSSLSSPSSLAQRVSEDVPSSNAKEKTKQSKFTNNNFIMKSANVPESGDKLLDKRVNYLKDGTPVHLDPQSRSTEESFAKVNGAISETNLPEELKDSPTASNEELIKLLRLQQERLSVQESQLKIVDSEIQYWETRENDFDKQYKTVHEETDRLQLKERSLNVSIQELDLVSWVDKLEIEKQQEKMLLSEITLVRSQLANAESELLAVKNKVHKLNEETDSLRSEHSQKEHEAKEEEIKVLHDISELQKQVNRKLVQHTQNQSSLEEVLGHVKDLESAILEKKTHIAKSEKELRDLNLDTFSKAPSTEWLATSTGEISQSEKTSNQISLSRPGSSRKMTHNPQHLKEAVATTRNPHGYWV